MKKLSDEMKKMTNSNKKPEELIKNYTDLSNMFMKDLVINVFFIYFRMKKQIALKEMI